MAVIAAGTGAVRVFRDGQADRILLIALRGVSTGDTLDVGPSGMQELLVINRAVVMGVTQFVEIAANFTGTIVTMPSGLSSDAGYLLAWGSGL